MAFGRMSERERARPMSEINVTPLVDVMLVLVVIFILAAPLLAGSLRLQLPRALESQPIAAGRSIVVSIDAAGQTYVDDVALTDDAVRARLRQIASEAPDAELQLRADVAVAYGRVVQVIDMAQGAGLHRIGFAVTPRD